MSAQVVWVAKDDGSDIIRADTIAGVGRDYNGDITARLAGGEGSAVTLVTPGTSDGPHTPKDFHRQLIKIVAELSHAAEATVVRPVCDESRGWRWVNEPMQVSASDMTASETRDPPGSTAQLMQAQEGEDELAAAALIPAWFSRQLKPRKSIEAREWYLPGRW